MKKEGRQHEMVRRSEIWDSRPPYATCRIANKFDSPATAGIFMKVSLKPSNQSKYTGKGRRSRCVGCHTHPASKSKDKGKGTNKERSYDDLLINRSSIAKNGVGSSYVGLSATAILGQLAKRDDQYWDDNYDEEDGEKEVEYDLDDVNNQSHGCSSDSLQDILPVLTMREIEEIDHEAGGEEEKEEEKEEEEEEEEKDDDDDDRMSFCEVGFVVELEDEEWCVVAEM
ncbi:hypothetical protein NE237_006648 [Protea cynaroides]|uniref:Uncharacterized protein n=1 Tax=Protea cynaroides TaxID=273540 RepID=A0A9Q0KN01_9MAGN|nr:hypothetical protein NE237_006648 [Protea cynaroides]